MVFSDEDKALITICIS